MARQPHSRQLFEIARLRERSGGRNTSDEIVDVPRPLGEWDDECIFELDDDLHVDPGPRSELVPACPNLDARCTRDAKARRRPTHSERRQGFAPNPGASVEKRHLGALDIHHDIAPDSEAGERGECVLDRRHTQQALVGLDCSAPLRGDDREL
jgi:hypothetical protein